MIQLTNDGTLDIVLRCSECGEELRYNSCEEAWDQFAKTPTEDTKQAYDAFVDWAIEDATNEHECSAPDDSEPESVCACADNIRLPHPRPCPIHG